MRLRSLMAAQFLASASVLFLAGNAAADGAAPAIQFDGRHFTPQSLSVPAGQPLAIKVSNASNETIEFESFKLNREVAMTPGQVVTVRLPALSPGAYDFYDDFHQDVPEGTIVAK